MSVETVTLTEAAKIIQMNPRTLRRRVQKDRLLTPVTPPNPLMKRNHLRFAAAEVQAVAATSNSAK